MRYPLILTTLLLALAAGRASAEVPRRATTPQIRQWIAQLDADDFAVREQAAASLTRAGQAAIAPLAEGVVSLNPEVAWRSSETLERIAMEGDEATMDRVVSVLGQLASRGKPQLAQFAAQMRDRQRIFRHNRAATAIRRLGGQVAGGDADYGESELGVSDLGIIEDVPAAAALERFIVEAPAFELPAEPADPKITEPAFDDVLAGEAKKPAWVKLLEAMKILEVKSAPKWEAIEIADGTKNVTEPEAEKEKPLPPDAPATAPAAGADKPAVGDRVAAAVLPGKVGAALRRALGLGQEKTVERAAAPPGEPAVAKAFEVLPLEEAAEAKADAIEAAAEVEAVDFGVVGVPMFFGGGGMFISDGGGMPGYMALGREWRGGDAGLKHLKDLSGISQLQIDHADLSDAALPHIAKLKSLTYVSIRGGKFSREALRAFHRQRPKVSLMAMGEGMMGVNGAFNAAGCFLDSVFEGSAAFDAGLRTGDKVTSIEGEPVRDFSDLTISVSTRKPGDALKVVYERGGEQREAKVTLKPRPPGQ